MKWHCFNAMRKRIVKIYGVLLAVGFGYWLWIRLTGLKIPCLYLLTTGLQCPGCGTTRMLLSLFRLDFISAFSYNPVVFVLFWIWNLIALFCFYGKIRKSRFLYIALGLSIAILVVFGLLRNMT